MKTGDTVNLNWEQFLVFVQSEGDIKLIRQLIDKVCHHEMTADEADKRIERILERYV